MGQLSLFTSDRERKLEKFLRRILEKLPMKLADEARHVLDGVPMPDYDFDRAKWFIDTYGRNYAYRIWFFNEYAGYYDKLGLGDIKEEILEDGKEVEVST